MSFPLYSLYATIFIFVVIDFIRSMILPCPPPLVLVVAVVLWLLYPNLVVDHVVSMHEQTSFSREVPSTIWKHPFLVTPAWIPL